jgi:hypothetical protein
MSYMKECAQLTQRYFREVERRELTIDDILQRPHYRQVWFWWLALSHFKERNHYKRLEDAPQGLEYITIMGTTRVEYKWDGQKYSWLQETTMEECKSIYGD